MILCKAWVLRGNPFCLGKSLEKSFNQRDVGHIFICNGKSRSYSSNPKAKVSETWSHWLNKLLWGCREWGLESSGTHTGALFSTPEPAGEGRRPLQWGEGPPDAARSCGGDLGSTLRGDWITRGQVALWSPEPGHFGVPLSEPGTHLLHLTSCPDSSPQKLSLSRLCL